MITKSDVLELAENLPQPTGFEVVQISDPDKDFRNIAGPEEMVVLLDPEKPDAILQHPVFGPLLTAQKAALFATGEDGKPALRAKPFPIEVHDGALGSVKVIHLTPGGKLNGESKDDNYGVPTSFRNVAADLKMVVQNAARTWRDVTGFTDIGLFLDLLPGEEKALADAVKALARGMGNVAANDDLYKGKSDEVLVDGALPEKKEGKPGPIDAVAKGVRQAVKHVYLVSELEALDDLKPEFQEGDTISRMQTFCRFLAECPHNLLDCETFVKVLMRLVQNSKLYLETLGLPQELIDIEIYGPNGAEAAGIPLTGSLDALKLNGLKAVHQGSEGELGPFMVRIKYRHPDASADEPVDLVVAKCVMQDDGGHCAKGKGAKDMQADMTGGASMAAITAHLAEKRPCTKLDIVFGVVSNTTDGKAYKVNDILELSSGVTVEVGNTDAEGRIVLADAGGAALKLHRAEGVETGNVTTVSTLTGHAIIVGGHRTVVSSTSRELLREIEDDATEVGEGLQGLQLDPHDFEALKKGAADVVNIVEMPVGPVNARGTSTAAAFIAKAMGLSEETMKAFTQWDIAGSLEFGKMGPKDTANWRLPVGNYLDTLYRYVTNYQR